MFNQRFMNIILTGSLGNTSKPLAQRLLTSGHTVTIISSDPHKINLIQALGAKAAIGSVEDVSFLTQAFTGADAIFTMVPPNWGVTNYPQYIAQIGKNYRDAIEASGVKRIVNLSSIGAHLPKGTGPVAGLYEVEQTLNALKGVAVKHLRAGIFYVNFFFDIPLIRTMGMMGNNYGPKAQLVLVHPRDIAQAAALELQVTWEDKSHRCVVSHEGEVAQIVQVLGRSIDKPDLPWVQLSDEETFAGMTAAGMAKAVAQVYVEMGNAIDSGILFDDFNQHRPRDWGSTKLVDFAPEFAAVYQTAQ